MGIFKKLGFSKGKKSISPEPPILGMTGFVGPVTGTPGLQGPVPAHTQNSQTHDAYDSAGATPTYDKLGASGAYPVKNRMNSTQVPNSGTFSATGPGSAVPGLRSEVAYDSSGPTPTYKPTPNTYAVNDNKQHTPRINNATVFTEQSPHPTMTTGGGQAGPNDQQVRKIIASEEKKVQIDKMKAGVASAQEWLANNQPTTVAGSPAPTATSNSEYLKATPTTSPQNQSAVKHTLAQLDNTDGIVVGGGTSNLTSLPSEDLRAKNHDIAVNLENSQASKAATDEKYADIKQAASDNALDIMSNAQKNTFHNTSAVAGSADSTETNTGRVGENGGFGTSTLASTTGNSNTSEAALKQTVTTDLNKGPVAGTDEAIRSAAALKLETLAAASPVNAINEQGLTGSMFTLPAETPGTVPIPPVSGLTPPDLGKTTPTVPHGARYGNDF